jgi:16S rRNA (uracil1498-N3)-methyltransferase
MYLFYTPDIDGDTHVLPEEESRHCTRVLRLGEGDAVTLTDGRGGWYHCRVTRADARRCEVTRVEGIEGYGRRDFAVHVAIAPTKNIERFEWFLEKCTEIGIDEITPLACERSERKVINAGRLEKVIIAAMKQSLKAYLPRLHPLTDSRVFLRDHRNALKFIAHCDAGERRPLHELYTPGADVTLLVGPEGDFSPGEIRLAAAHDYRAITLGESRLRAETAGVVACHAIHLLNAMAKK